MVWVRKKCEWRMEKKSITSANECVPSRRTKFDRKTRYGMASF